MRIGIPKEIKTHEYRVGLTPASVRELVHRGHSVFLETYAGEGSGFCDTEYQNAGASILQTPEDIFAIADLIVKVKEPQPSECNLLRPGQILFTFLHLSPDPGQAHKLLNASCVAIAYETVTNSSGGLPLLAPMSEIAGRVSAQVGARMLEKLMGGRGILLGGATGVLPAKVVILGGGVAGLNAARIASGMGADVMILDKNTQRLHDIDLWFHGTLKTACSQLDLIEQSVAEADLIIGSVLIPGGSSPKLVTTSMVSSMHKGAVLIDVSIDQGGCFETSRPTTHENPTYFVDGVVHYCVTNIPGVVPRTSTLALNNATLPFVIALADKGYRQALQDDPFLAAGLNVWEGNITHPAVAESLGYPCKKPEFLLGG